MAAADCRYSRKEMPATMYTACWRPEEGMLLPPAGRGQEAAVVLPGREQGASLSLGARRIASFVM